MERAILITFLLVGVISLTSALAVSEFLPIVSPGVCQDNSTCKSSAENSFCDFQEKLQCGVGVCQCLPEYVAVSSNPKNENATSCIPKAANIGDECQDNLQCTSAFGGDSACMSNPNNNTRTCQCQHGSIFCEDSDFNPRGCRPTKNLGDFCEDCDSQCDHIPNAICDRWSDIISRCLCDVGYIQIDGLPGAPNFPACVPKAAKLGDSCSIHPRQCDSVPESHCDIQTRTCICNNATHIASPSNQSCLPKREHLNMRCEVQDQCLAENSKCEQLWPFPLSFCFCPIDFEESEDQTSVCVAELGHGKPCTEDEQCTIYLGKNAECSSKHNMTCRCKHGYLHSSKDPEYGNCVPALPLGAPCTLSRWQCVDALGFISDMTYCIGGVCSCNYNYRELNGICYKQIKVGGLCETDDECRLWISGPAICNHAKGKKCECDGGYVVGGTGDKCQRGW